MVHLIISQTTLQAIRENCKVFDKVFEIIADIEFLQSSLKYMGNECHKMYRFYTRSTYPNRKIKTKSN